MSSKVKQNEIYAKPRSANVEKHESNPTTLDDSKEA